MGDEIIFRPATMVEDDARMVEVVFSLDISKLDHSVNAFATSVVTLLKVFQRFGGVENLLAIFLVLSEKFFEFQVVGFWRHETLLYHYRPNNFSKPPLPGGRGLG